MTRKVNQIGIVVKDLDSAMEFYKQFFDVGVINTLEVPNYHCELKGELCTYSMKMGFVMLGDLQIEFIQELEGSSPYSEFIARQGEGVHHLGYYVADFDTELARVADTGIMPYARGELMGLRWAYLDTEASGGGVMHELIEVSQKPAHRKK